MLVDALPKLFKLCCLIVTIPVTTSLVERTFSVLKRTQTFQDKTGKMQLFGWAMISKTFALQVTKLKWFLGRHNEWGGGVKPKSNSLIGKVYSYFVNINVIVTFKNKKRRKKTLKYLLQFIFFDVNKKITLIAWSTENFSICKWYTNAHINTEVCAENSWLD